MEVTALKARKVPGYGELVIGDVIVVPDHLGRQFIEQGLVARRVSKRRPEKKEEDA